VSAEQYNAKVGRFLLDNLELFGVDEQKEELQREIRCAANLLLHSDPLIDLDMRLSEIENVLANPPVNDIDSDIGNRLGKIFKAFSKNIPMFQKCENPRAVAIAVATTGLIARDVQKLKYDEMNEEIGKVIDCLQKEGILENCNKRTIDAATRYTTGFRDVATIPPSVKTSPRI